MALQQRVGGHDRILRQHSIKLRAECSRLTQAGKLLKRICHHGGYAGEKPNPNDHWQNRGSPNRSVQPVIVGDRVEVGDDHADQAPRQLRLVSYLLGRATATQQQQPQHGSGRNLERLAPCCVGLDNLLPCPSSVFESTTGRSPCPVYVAPDIRDGAAAGSASDAPALHPAFQNRAGRAVPFELRRA